MDAFGIPVSSPQSKSYVPRGDGGGPGGRNTLGLALGASSKGILLDVETGLRWTTLGLVAHSEGPSLLLSLTTESIGLPLLPGRGPRGESLSGETHLPERGGTLSLTGVLLRGWRVTTTSGDLERSSRLS